MTTRDRRLAKAERLRAWADKREQKSRAAFAGVRQIADGIPMGQPILIGHHSEKRHRKDIDRMDRGMRRGIESQEMARDMTSRAGNIEDAVDRAIYRDDPDAIERLTAKLAELEGRRARYKAENAAYRKGDTAFAACLGIDLAHASALREKIEAGYSWCRQPHPSYSLQNLGGTITKERKRLAELVRLKTPVGEAFVSSTVGETATARAGLLVTATLTTPSRPGKKPRPVWTVSGNLAYWRPLLVDTLGGNVYHGTVSFWDDPTAEIEAACLEAEAPRTEEAATV